MEPELRAHRYDAARVEQVCEAVHDAAAGDINIDDAVNVIVSITDRDSVLAGEALSACARRSLSQADGWFQAARLLERALATDRFNQP